MRSGQHKAPRPASELLWFFVQITALMAIFLVPLLSAKSTKKLGSEERAVVVEKAELQPAEAKPARTITSQVIKLPPPESQVPSKTLTFKSSAKQVRFQKGFVSESLSLTRRSPASTSLKSNQWELIKVEKTKLDKNQKIHRESVPLLRSSENNGAISSVYIELDPQINIFEVTYKNLRGEKKVMKVRVNYKMSEMVNSDLNGN